MRFWGMLASALLFTSIAVNAENNIKVRVLGEDFPRDAIAAARELLQVEAIRLTAVLGNDPKLTLINGSPRLSAVLDSLSKSSLTRDQAAEVLGLLRLHGFGGNVSQNAKNLVLGELARFQVDPGIGHLELPEDVLNRLGVTSKVGLSKIIQGIQKAPLERLSVSDWARMLGTSRMEARRKRSEGFLAEVRQDLGRVLGFKVNQAPRMAGRFSGPRPLPRGNVGRGFPGGRGGGVVLRGGIPSRDLTPTAERRLSDLTAKGHVSLPMETSYPGAPNVRSSCQLTLTSKQEMDMSGQTCTYSAATARHCVENERGQAFSQIRVFPFSSVDVYDTRFEPSGADLAMMRFEARCRNDVPIIPVAMEYPPDGEGIVVYGRAPLKGQARNLIDRNNQILDVRGSGDIFQGDSGGAVRDSKGQLVGVISSKLVEYPGVGTFATSPSFVTSFLSPAYAESIQESVVRLSPVHDL